MESSNDIVGKIVEGYKIIKFLGRGKFSTVYQAERQKDQKLVALKIIKIYDIMDKNLIDKCLQEVNLLQKVSHPNIVKYLDSFIGQNELFIAIEWADKGDVKRLIKKYKQEGDLLDEPKVIEYTREIASALQHMHDKRVIHRDLKPANILIFSDGTFKLGDLGLGRFMSDETFKAFSKVGTPLYMAPEVINNIGYDFKSDNWSLGCVVYELITLKSPFQTDEKISMMDLFKKINTGQYPHITNEKYALSSKIVDSLLKVNPEERSELNDIIKQCEDYLAKQEEKPRIDPFIVMDDIMEKLRLINYEENFCNKYNKEVIPKYYFACSIYGYDYNENSNNNSNDSFPTQFAYFYDLCNWLMLITRQNVNLEILQEFEIKFKKYDKKKQHLTQMNDLITDLKNMDIKIVKNSKFKYGYGEGICLALTQLCDKYLMKQNFIFKKPKFEDHVGTVEVRTAFDDIVLEENIGTNIGFKSNTNYNFANQFKSSLGSGSKSRFFAGMGKKRFYSQQNNDDTAITTDFSTNEDDIAFKPSPSTMILQPNIDQGEWYKELTKVENILEIPEVPEYLEESNGNNIVHSNLDIAKKLSNFSVFLEHMRECFERLSFYVDNVEKSLNKIRQAEKTMSGSVSIKTALEKTEITKKAIGHYKEDIQSIEKEISNLLETKEKIEKKIEKIKKLENSYTEKSENGNYNNIREIIKNLKKEIKKYDTEIELFNTACFGKTNLITNNFNNKNKFNNLSLSGGYSNSNEEINDPIFDEIDN